MDSIGIFRNPKTDDLVQTKVDQKHPEVDTNVGEDVGTLVLLDGTFRGNQIIFFLVDSPGIAVGVGIEVSLDIKVRRMDMDFNNFVSVFYLDDVVVVGFIKTIEISIKEETF